MRAPLWKAHRWLGLLTMVGVLMWGLSGVMHPIMSRLQPAPAQFMPPPLAWRPAEAPNPALALRALGLNEVHSLHSVVLDGQVHWLAHRHAAQPGVLVHAISGQAVPDGEQVLAKALARHYAGLADTPVHSVRLLTQFDEHYGAVNRLLPVWEVRFARDDGLRAYLDTRQMRLATLTNHTRHTLATTFQWAHNWRFLQDWPWLQRTVMSALLLAATVSAITGLYFWWVLRPSAQRRLAQRPWRRWHRRLGLLVAITSLAFASSGGLHLWMKVARQTSASAPAGLQMNRQATPLNLPSDAAWQGVQALGMVGRVDLIQHEPQAAWWVQGPGSAGPRAQVAALAHPSSHPHAQHGDGAAHTTPRNMTWLVNHDGRSVPDAGPQLAKALAARYSGLAATHLREPTLVTTFGGEYGFLNKRLPVWRVPAEAPGHPRYYVELSSGALAARVDDLDALEGAVFSVLHKWQWGNLPKDLRDLLAATAAIGNVLVALIGLSLLVRRPQAVVSDDR